MNNFFQENIFAIILFLLLIILLLIALIGVIVVKLLLAPKDATQAKPATPPVAPTIVPEVVAQTFKQLSEEKVAEENSYSTPSEVGNCDETLRENEVEFEEEIQKSASKSYEYCK